jgi:hypothetical protein
MCFQCASFYNEMKSRVAMNIKLGFLSGPHLVKNQIKHKRNRQVLKKNYTKVDSKWIQR